MATLDKVLLSVARDVKYTLARVKLVPRGLVIIILWW
jgi:hypothetical protein